MLYRFFEAFLAFTLQNYWRSAAPLNVTMPIMKRMRLALPAMRRIWGSTITSDKAWTYEWTLNKEKEFQHKLDEGLLDLSARLAPKEYGPPVRSLLTEPDHIAGMCSLPNEGATGSTVASSDDSAVQ